MASSFVEQVPVIVFLLKKLNPQTVLDVGKGFGKYGFLLHEYVGIDQTKRQIRVRRWPNSPASPGIGVVPVV